MEESDDKGPRFVGSPDSEHASILLMVLRDREKWTARTCFQLCAPVAECLTMGARQAGMLQARI